MVEPAPGIQLPAAQVQDRGDRRGRGPGGDRRARYRPAHRPQRGGRDRLQGAGRRRARADADDRQDRPRFPAQGRIARLSRGDHARLQSRGPARQQVQGADQDPRPRDRRRGVHRAGRGGVRRARRARDRRRCRAEIARIAAYFAPPAYEALPARVRGVRSGARRDPDFARFARDQSLPAQDAGLHRGHGLAEADRRAAGRRHLGPDAGRSPTSPSAISFDELRVTHVQNLVLPHVRLDDVPAVWAALVEAGLADRQCRADHRHHRLPGHGLLQARHRPLDPDRAGDREALRRCRARRR